ncbi:unnamed protein product [Prorocentrum cordatum]|uniref:Uncharacterized protein n=1 Tax=Prorocentrum cordatum TaxID=2364126 RepID=A0ABN9WTQ8_9DINO|nr:unnamed protein product [Polarella glacialis]
MILLATRSPAPSPAFGAVHEEGDGQGCVGIQSWPRARNLHVFMVPPLLSARSLAPPLGASGARAMLSFSCCLSHPERGCVHVPASHTVCCFAAALVVVVVVVFLRTGMTTCRKLETGRNQGQPPLQQPARCGESRPSG